MYRIIVAMLFVCLMILPSAVFAGDKWQTATTLAKLQPGAVIEEDIFLRDVTLHSFPSCVGCVFKGKLIIRYSKIEAIMDFSEAVFHKDVEITSSTISSMDFEKAVFESRLDLSYLDISSCGIYFDGAKLTNVVDLRKSKMMFLRFIDSDLEGATLYLDGTSVWGGRDFSFSKGPKAIHATGKEELEQIHLLAPNTPLIFTTFSYEKKSVEDKGKTTQKKK